MLSHRLPRATAARHPDPDFDAGTAATERTSTLPGRAPLDGQRVAVIGGGGSMGRGVAREVIALGAEAMLLGRTLSTLDAAVSELGAMASAHVVDATDTDALHGTLAAMSPMHHIVVAASAGVRGGHVADMPAVNARRAFERFWTCHSVLQASSRLLQDDGSVTLLSGSSARTPAAGAGIWTALHGAIEALARGAAIDLAPRRVNVVSPGGIGMAPDRQLVPRRGTPADIGAAVASLVANRAITGAVLDVDSGERRGTWSGGTEAWA